MRRAFRVPVVALVVAAALHAAIGRRLGFPAVVWGDAIYPGAVGTLLRDFNAFTPVMGFSLCVFNIAVIAQEFAMLFQARARTGAAKDTPAALWWLGVLPGFVHTLLALPPPSRRRYGGYVVHVGIIIMFIGFTGQSWNIDRETSLYPGQSERVGAYTLTYVGPRMEVDNNKRMIFADVDVAKNGRFLEHLMPAKFIYKKQPESPTTEVAIGHGLRDDVYVIVGTINPSTKLASLQIHLNPLVSWIWIGCIVLIAGSIVCMWPQLELGESRVWAGARGVSATAASVVLGIMLAATPVAHAQAPMSGSGTVHIENDLERSVFGALRCMCGTCARDLLSTCTCETAEEARAKIRAQLKAGETRDQVLAEYEAQFGPESLAVPPNHGVLRAIWAVPVAAIGLGAIGLAKMLRGWRESSSRGVSVPRHPAAESKTRDSYDAWIDEELKSLDE